MLRRGRIDAYLDPNSPFSYFALFWLKRNKQVLADHGVEVEYHPIFLGGIMAGSGNKPPWTVPAKANMSTLDRVRTQQYLGAPAMNRPPFFPILTLLPLRCMLYVKDHFPARQYEALFEELWVAYWQQHMDISKAEVLTAVLGRHFSADEAAQIVEGGTSPKYKQMLTAETARLVELGAYGAPWLLVTDRDGRVESFFGSDRFHFVMRFLGVPHVEFALEPAKSSRL